MKWRVTNKMKEMPVIILLVTTLFGMGPVLAEEDALMSQISQQARESIKRFDLYVDCKPMPVLIESMTSDAEKIGLTKKRIRTAVEARLRSARIYDDGREPSHLLHSYLYIQVSVSRSAFYIKLALQKMVMDSHYSGVDSFAETWNQSTMGMHAQRSDYILSLIQELLDEFIVEYLRVNQDACDQKP